MLKSRHFRRQRQSMLWAAGFAMQSAEGLGIETNAGVPASREDEACLGSTQQQRR
ncbi:MAG TPA: hypothetical protein VGX03_31610 [Candidatus Binatia bacterium]|jgi:hypothetical protein|nr:hypothetical protein [Candidatus Binatia bacterium]